VKFKQADHIIVLVPLVSTGTLFQFQTEGLAALDHVFRDKVSPSLLVLYHGWISIGKIAREPLEVAHAGLVSPPVV
jgi:hypothetical protein